MKRLAVALFGAVLSGLISYGLVELFASWYAPRYVRSDSDIGDFFMASLGFMLVCMIAGAVVGFKWASKGTSGKGS